MEFKEMRGEVFYPRKLYANTTLPVKLFSNKKHAFLAKQGIHTSIKHNVLFAPIYLS